MNENEVFSRFYTPGLTSLSNIVKLACVMIDDPKKKGAFFCAGTLAGKPYFLTPIGIVPDDLVPKYSGLSLEKVERLGSHPDHISGWMSRDEDNAKYGGAIPTPRNIISLSGLPEKWDEACVLAFALHRLSLPLERLRQIAIFSNNPFIGPLLARIDSEMTHIAV